MLRSLELRAALVTGGGSVIGRACAHELAANGVAVAVVDLLSEAAAAAADEIRATGGRAEAVIAGVTSFAGTRAMVDEVVGCFGGLDIAVNNTGVGHDLVPLGRDGRRDR